MLFWVESLEEEEARLASQLKQDIRLTFVPPKQKLRKYTTQHQQTTNYTSQIHSVFSSIRLNMCWYEIAYVNHFHSLDTHLMTKSCKTRTQEFQTCDNSPHRQSRHMHDSPSTTSAPWSCFAMQLPQGSLGRIKKVEYMCRYRRKCHKDVIALLLCSCMVFIYICVPVGGLKLMCLKVWKFFCFTFLLQ